MESKAKKAKLEENDTVEGYIVDVKNLTQSKKSPNVKYFNFTVQTSAEHYSKGVCFLARKTPDFRECEGNEKSAETYRCHQGTK